MNKRGAAGDDLVLFRALDDWRRGWPLTITDGDSRSWLVLPLDTATPQSQAAWKRETTEPRLLLRSEAGAWTLGTLPEQLDPADLLSSGAAALAGVSDRPSDDCAGLLVQAARRTGLLPLLAMAPLRGEMEGTGFLPLIAGDFLRFLKTGPALRLAATTDLPIRVGGETVKTHLSVFRADDGSPSHLALRFGHPDPAQPVAVRVHSACFTGDLLGSLRCDCGDQLHAAITHLSRKGGYLLYLAQEGRGLGLVNKLRAYALQDRGLDTVEANERLGFAADERHFAAAAHMLRHFGVDHIRLLTNNPRKVGALESAGIKIVERIPLQMDANPHNDRYLRIKAEKLGHFLHRAAR